MTSSDFLKRDIEAADRAAAKRKRLGLLIATGVLAVSLFAFYRVQARPAHDRQDAGPSVSESTGDSSQSSPADANAAATQSVAPPVTNSQPTKPGQVTKPSPVQATAAGIDRAAFIADANKTLVSYGQITSLLTFNSTDSDAVKVDRIAQATALDRQAFNQVTNLRGRLVVAGISSGKYMDLTNLAESGVSKISTGLIFMNYWVNDHSRTTDLNVGSGSVGEGASTLLELSRQLGTL